MLEKLRNNINSVFSKLFLLLLAASFALWGVGDIFSPDQDPTLAEVGDMEVTANQFISSYQRIISELNSSTNGNFTEEMAQSLGLPNQTLNQLINERIYDLEVEKINLILPEKHLKELILSSPAFKDQFGQFNKEQFQFTLRQIGMDEKQYLKEISNTILREQVRNIIQPHNDITNTIGNTFYKLRNEQRAIETINFSASSYQSEIVPSDLDIENELTDNYQLYQVPEYRSFSIMTLRPDDLLSSINIGEEEIKSEFDNYPEKYNIAEKREVFLTNFSSEEEARNMINKISDEINDNNSENKKDIFNNVITSNSDKSKEALYLGNVIFAELPEEVATSVFSAEKNKIIGPEETAFGWRIFLVNEIEPEVIMTFDDVKDQIEKEIKVNIALEKMYELGNIFYDELAMGNNITDAASSINAKVRDINFIDNKGIDINGDIVEDLPPFPELIDTVFSTNDNDTSDIINTISNIMYAIQINEIKPQRTMNLNEAKNKIIENFKNRENMTIAKKYAEQFYLDITNGANFNELSKKYNLVTIESPSVKRDGTGSEGVVNSEAIDKIFSLKVNEITSPTIYNNSYTISKITQIIPTNTDSAEDINLINSNIINDISDEIHNIFINHFSKKYNIKINNQLLNSLFSDNS